MHTLHERLRSLAATVPVLALALALTLSLGACSAEPTAREGKVDAGSNDPDAADASPCFQAPGDPDAGRVGCGNITCDVGTAPLCLYYNRHDGSCYASTRCEAVPIECAADVSCSCLMALPGVDGGTSDAGLPGLGGGDRFCGTRPTSTRACFANGPGITVRCSPI